MAEDKRFAVEQAGAQARAVIVDGEDMFDIDTTAADKLTERRSDLEARGVALYLARVHAPTLELIRHEGVVEAVGEENVFPTVHDAVQAYRGMRKE